MHDAREACSWDLQLIEPDQNGVGLIAGGGGGLEDPERAGGALEQDQIREGTADVDAKPKHERGALTAAEGGRALLEKGAGTLPIVCARHGALDEAGNFRASSCRRPRAQGFENELGSP